MAFNPSENDLKRLLQSLEDKYFMIRINGSVMIGYWDEDELGDPKFVNQTIQDFKNWHINQTVWVDKKESKSRLADYFLEHGSYQKYTGLTFDFQKIGNTPGDNKLNLWRGYQVQPRTGEVQPWLDLVDSLMGGNPELINYFINYFAHLIQKPQDLPGVALVMRGAQGVGKGSVIEPLNLILGQHAAYANSQNQFMGRFDAHLATALLIFADESVWGGDKSAEGALKGMITNPVLSVEDKHKPIYKIRNYRRMIFATNEDWAVPVGEGDRRYFVVDVGGKYDKNSQFWEDVYYPWLNNGGASALLAYLQEVDISGFKVRRIPDTTAKTELKLLNLNNLMAFIYDMLNENLQVDGNSQIGEMPKRKVYQLYKDWIACRSKYPLNDNVFWSKIYKVIKSGKQMRQREGNSIERIFSFDMAQARQDFADYLQADVHAVFSEQSKIVISDDEQDPPPF